MLIYITSTIAGVKVRLRKKGGEVSDNGR